MRTYMESDSRKLVLTYKTRIFVEIVHLETSHIYSIYFIKTLWTGEKATHWSNHFNPPTTHNTTPTTPPPIATAHLYPQICYGDQTFVIPLIYNEVVKKIE